MAKLYNLARMTTATTGTGTITLGSAVTSYVSFADAGVQNGETVTYAIVDGNNREIGRGVYTASGTTLTRATILESTNSNAAINLSGNAEVFITAAAEDIANKGETNTFTASQVISVTDNSNAALRITQEGTGDTLVIEDSANPDSTPIVVNNGGRIIAGHTSDIVSHKLQVVGATSNDSAVSQLNYSGLSSPASYNFYKSRSSTIGSHTSVSANDALGNIVFHGSDGTSFVQAAVIQVAVDGTPGTNDMPGRIVFSTTGDGSSVASEKFRIGSEGQIGIIGGNYGTSGQVLTSGGSSSPPSWQTINNTQVSGLGTMASQNSDNVTITGGSISGITDLAIADGGTGASTAANARTNLGLGTIATQAASSVSITGGSITNITDLVVADGGTGVSSFTAYGLIAGGTTSTGALQSISGLGTSGQVLTSNGAGALPTWQSASSGVSGTVVHIGTAQGLVGSDQAGIVFTSIPSTYSKLLAFFVAAVEDGDGSLQVALSSNNGSTYGTNRQITGAATSTQTRKWIGTAIIDSYKDSGTNKTITPVAHDFENMSSYTTTATETSVTGVINALRFRLSQNDTTRRALVILYGVV